MSRLSFGMGIRAEGERFHLTNQDMLIPTTSDHIITMAFLINPRATQPSQEGSSHTNNTGAIIMIIMIEIIIILKIIIGIIPNIIVMVTVILILVITVIMIGATIIIIIMQTTGDLV